MLFYCCIGLRFFNLHMRNDTKGGTLYMKKRRGLALDIVLLLLLMILFITAYTFILQRDFSDKTLEAAVQRDIQCSDAIHTLVSNKFTREDYNEINSREDMDSDRYKRLQGDLNELRTLNSTRYLYTAKHGNDGRLIYLIDGLDLDAEDFAYPGTYIEDEMIPYIEAALSGETIYSQEIMDTTWGHIFTACYPVTAYDGTGDIIGALCIEIDMESSYKVLAASNHAAFTFALTAITAAVLLAIVLYLAFRKQREKEAAQQQLLKEAADAADAANKAKSTFLFNMSHDIRTPMNAILGYSELAGRHLDSPDLLQSYLGHIRECGKNMLSIIDNVLELSRIENGNITLDETIVQADSFLDACIVMVQSALDRKEQELTVARNIIYPYIYLDMSRAMEIALNLVSNAIKYTGEGGSIHCSISQTAGETPDTCMLEFSVSDNGIGMSESYQKHIFESFSRERSSTASGIQGSGLGMGIVKKVVDMMKGTIEIKSELGKGSTFTVRIPCRIAEKEDVVPKRTDVHPDRDCLKGKRILMAEDNDLNAEIAMELLGEEGLLIDRAADGADCIAMLEKAPAHYYSMILMDIQMPVLNGYDAAKQIRKLTDPAKANIPIIAMTANAFAEDRERALASGMNDHVAKPVDMNKLVPVILKYL